MAKLDIPAAPDYKTREYSNLKGADFSVDPSLVDPHHSPDLINMISQEGGTPRKRKGWRLYDTSADGKQIDNIWQFYMDGVECAVTAHGSTIQNIDLSTYKFGDVSFASSGEHGKRGAFFMQTALHAGLYILDVDKLLEVSYTKSGGMKISEVSPYIPTILIDRAPSSGGGSVLESVNLLTRKRIEKFYQDGTGLTYLCSSTIGTLISFEYVDANGNWAKDTSATANGATVTVTTAHKYVVSGESNVRITYEASGTDKFDRITKCTNSAHFPQGAMDQVFLTGNPDYPQYIYYSQLGDPTYFPDLNYLLLSGGGKKIMGLMNIGGALAAIKESSTNDTAVFLINSAEINDGSTSVTDATQTSRQTTTTTNSYAYNYKITQGTSGIGAISKNCFKTLNDEPLFFSTSGVCGIISTNVTDTKVTRNRSRFLDSKLLKESNPENAVAEVFNNYYILVLNDRAYVLDGRQKTSDQSGNTNYLYESYYWDNIPAKSLCVISNKLFFGTSDGRLCAFKNTDDSDPMSVYDYSDGTYGEPLTAEYVEGTAIVCEWSTPNDNDGATQWFKTIQKKASLCSLAPFSKSSVKVYVEIDGNERQFIGYTTVDIWGGFSDINFDRFAFDVRTGPRDKFFNKKIKKYKRLKIILINDAINEGFGVHEIIKTYVLTRFAK